MEHAELANPIWHSLLGAQSRFALALGELRWFPPAIAPFVAVPRAAVVPDLDAAARAAFKSPAYFAGVLPAALPEHWIFAARSQVLQMIPATVHGLSADEEDIQVLQDADRPQMLTLAQAAFPDYFRERTAELGLREISGVCTHPEYTGRGFARRLTRALVHRHRRSGVESFLHVSESNSSALRLYESMGFVVCGSVELGKVERAA